MNAILSTPPKEPTFVKAKFLATRYAVTTACILQWAKLGKLPCVRFQETVRFDLEACAAIIEGTDRPARPQLARA